MMRIGRRRLLAALGATAAVFNLRPRAAVAGQRGVPAASASNRWLVDASLSAREYASWPVMAPTRLDADLVRQWRSGLGRELRGAAGGATALVRWDKAFVLQGLAREAGFSARVERLSSGLFRVTLASRA